MNEPLSNSSIFISGAARFSDLLYILAHDKGLAADDIDHSRFLAFDQGAPSHNGDATWRAVDLCVARLPSEKMIAVGEDGEVLTYAGGVTTEEQIEPRPTVLRAVNTIDGYAVACGMRRQVYIRTDEEAWSAINVPETDEMEGTGFEAIAGYSMDEIYAVGWNGEIWKWDGKEWHDQVSPTNIILTGVTCAGDGYVYVCGQDGALIRGRDGRWTVLDVDNMNSDFWDVHWFDGKLYIATMQTLYCYGKKGLSRLISGMMSRVPVIA